MSDSSDSDRRAAVDGDALAGDVTAGFRRQQRGRACDLVEELGGDARAASSDDEDLAELVDQLLSAPD